MTIARGPERSATETAVHRLLARAGRLVFGDRFGLVVFLVALAFVATYWRVGIFITDNYAVANGLVNAAHGHLAVTDLQYSITFGSQPGLYVADGTIYARNYAHIFASLPVLWLLQALSIVADPSILVAAGYSFVLLALFDQAGRLLDRYRTIATMGAILALGTFLANVILAQPLAEKWLPFVALQLTAMLATALTGVALYRLFVLLHGRRVGTFAGLAIVIASPVGFWASIPKRHVLTALAVTVTVGTFYAARETDEPRRALFLRAASYATVALLAWLQAMEALVVLVTLVPFDLATMRSAHPKQVAVVALVFLVALAPFLATNYAMSGNPLNPPRSNPSFHGQVEPGGQQSNAGPSSPKKGSAKTSAVNTATDRNSATSKVQTEDKTTAGKSPTTSTPGSATPSDGSSRGGGGGFSPISVLAGLIAAVTALGHTIVDRSLWALGKGWGLFADGVDVVRHEPGRVYHTFVRSGRIPDHVNYAVNDQEAIELTILETAPLLGALAGTVGVAVRRTIARPTLAEFRHSLARPARQTDLFVAALALLFTLTYMPRLPLQTELTVRYLLPIVPLGLYGVARLASVHRVLRTRLQWLAGTYLVTLAIGAIALLTVNALLNLAVGEVMQLHALLALASVVPLALWAVVDGYTRSVDTRVGAVVIAVPTALTTLFLLFAGLGYFQYGQYALGLTRSIADALPVLP